MKTVLIYSGGLDSTVLLYKLLKESAEVKCLSVNYGQRHVREIAHGLNITRALNVEHRVVDLSVNRFLFAGSSQTSSDIPVPDGHYADETMKITVVPNRNMVMISLAAAWAVSNKFDSVAYAAHAGDHTIYPDCREDFCAAMHRALLSCDWNSLVLLRPFMTKSKADIVLLGQSLGVPFEETWSCYKGGEKHCGMCGTDMERKEAFRLAGVPDSTEYDDNTGVYRG